MTDFRNFFTAIFRKELWNKNLLKFLPHLKSVAALPCETWNVGGESLTPLIYRAVCAGTLSCWNMSLSPDISLMHGNSFSFTIIVAIHFHSRLHNFIFHRQCTCAQGTWHCQVLGGQPRHSSWWDLRSPKLTSSVWPKEEWVCVWWNEHKWSFIHKLNIKHSQWNNGANKLYSCSTSLHNTIIMNLKETRHNTLLYNYSDTKYTITIEPKCRTINAKSRKVNLMISSL